MFTRLARQSGLGRLLALSLLCLVLGLFCGILSLYADTIVLPPSLLPENIITLTSGSTALDGGIDVGVNDGPIFASVRAAVDAATGASDVVKVCGACLGA